MKTKRKAKQETTAQYFNLCFLMNFTLIYLTFDLNITKRIQEGSVKKIL